MRVNSSPNVMFIQLTVYQVAVGSLESTSDRVQIEKLAVFSFPVGSLVLTLDVVPFSNRAVCSFQFFSWPTWPYFKIISFSNREQETQSFSNQHLHPWNLLPTEFLPTANYTKKTSANLKIKQHPRRVLQQFFHFHQKGNRRAAVYDAVVVRQG